MNTHDTFDFEFRPDYWSSADPITAITRGIKGELRRRMVRDILSGSAAERAPDEDSKHTLSEVVPKMLDDALDTPDLLGRTVHPGWLGGEYLPDSLPGEVEIARIVMPETTLLDVISIRARLGSDGRIHYRIVDEYETKIWSQPENSDRPFTLREMVQYVHSIDVDPSALLDGTVLSSAPEETYVHYLRTQGESGDWHTVVVESPFYPDLKRYFEEQTQELEDAASAEDDT